MLPSALALNDGRELPARYGRPLLRPLPLPLASSRWPPGLLCGSSPWGLPQAIVGLLAWPLGSRARRFARRRFRFPFGLSHLPRLPPVLGLVGLLDTLGRRGWVHVLQVLPQLQHPVG